MRCYYVVIVTDPSTHLMSYFNFTTLALCADFAYDALKAGLNVCVEKREILTHFEDWGK